MPKQLVIASTRSDTELKQLLREYRVLAVLPPRIAVVDSDAAGIDRLRAAQEIIEVLTAPSDIPKSELNVAEKLFVDAWNARRNTEKKIRPGEGLPWDAEGFQPPDWPKDKT
jgi:hypothetical protein